MGRAPKSINYCQLEFNAYGNGINEIFFRDPTFFLLATIRTAGEIPELPL